VAVTDALPQELPPQGHQHAAAGCKQTVTTTARTSAERHWVHTRVIIMSGRTSLTACHRQHLHQHQQLAHHTCGPHTRIFVQLPQQRPSTGQHQPSPTPPPGPHGCDSRAPTAQRPTSTGPGKAAQRSPPHQRPCLTSHPAQDADSATACSASLAALVLKLRHATPNMPIPPHHHSSAKTHHDVRGGWLGHQRAVWSSAG